MRACPCLSHWPIHPALLIDRPNETNKTTGGLTVYCGPLGDKAQALIGYFEAVDGTPKFSAAENPASWMLVRGLVLCVRVVGHIKAVTVF